jgi:hypothetical protein
MPMQLLPFWKAGFQRKAAPVRVAGNRYYRPGIEVLEQRRVLTGPPPIILGIPSSSAFLANATAAAAGDFNGDGRLDVAVASSGPNGALSLNLSQGDGHFATAATSPLSGFVSGIAISDLNADGKPDIVIAEKDPGLVCVYQGTGTGTLANPTTYRVGAPVTALEVGDFNGDGFPDIAVATTTGQIDVFVNTRLGTFGAPIQSSLGTGCVALAAADFNGDGRLDLAAVGPTFGVKILLGKGDGTFNAPLSIVADPAPVALVAVDLNKDGHTDIATVDATGYATVLLGNGKGTFGPPIQTGSIAPDVDAGSMQVATADFYSNGWPELILSNGRQLGILYNGGSSGFSAPVLTYTGPDTVALLAGNFIPTSSTPIPDIVVVSAYPTPAISLFAGPGLGSQAASPNATAVASGPFAPRLDFGAGASPFGMVAADFNGDGLPDVAGLDNASGLLDISLNAGEGNFTLNGTLAVGHPCAGLAAGDFNGDGIVDLAVGLTDTPGVAIYSGNGHGGFGAPVIYSVDRVPVELKVIDANGDGKPDIAVRGSNTGYCVLLNTGNGTFSAPVDSNVGPGPGFVVGDFNGDGISDLAALAPNGVNVWFGKSSGGYQAPTFVNLGLQATDALAAADLNGDGRTDLVVSEGPGGTLDLLKGRTDGTFDFSWIAARPEGPTPAATTTLLAIRDLNGDGRPDIVVSNPEQGQSSIGVLLNLGNGQFASPIDYLVPGIPNNFCFADFNRDGTVDLAVATSTPGSSGSLLFGVPPTEPHFAVSGPVTAVGGNLFPLTVTALDPNGHLLTGFTGKVTLVADGGLTLATYTFTAADAGTHTFTVSISGNSTHTITAYSLTATGGTQLTVQTSSSPSDVWAVDAGGAAVGNFLADTGFSGGKTYSTPAAISTSGVSNPAPQAVYQTERYGNFGYTAAGLTPGGTYTVRLHFAELYWTGAGQRLFIVTINGTQVLTNFDIFATAGGKDIAIVESFTATANSSGQIVISFTSIKDNAKVSGIEILTAGTAPSVPAPITGLTATASNAQVVLNWTASSTATSYNIYRSTSSGVETLLKSGVTATSYTDAGLANGTTYYYEVTAVNSAGESGRSSEVSATAQATVWAVDAGGGAAGNFKADGGFTGGTPYSTTAAINTSSVTNPAPQAVYQTERYGNFTYKATGLTPGASYTVRLHFAELYWTGAGKRLFNVTINGTQVLTNFDIFATAGGKDIAIVESFTATADASGSITIGFSSVKDNAKVSGIEIVPAVA